MREKYNSESAIAPVEPVAQYKERIKELENVNESQEADIKRLNKDLDLLIEELRQKNRQFEDGSKKAKEKEEVVIDNEKVGANQMDKDLVESLIGSLKFKDVNDVLQQIKSMQEQRENDMVNFCVEVFRLVHPSATVNDELSFRGAAKSFDLQSLKEVMERLKQQLFDNTQTNLKSNDGEALNSSSGSFKPSSALTSLLRKHVDADASSTTNSNINRPRTLSASSTMTEETSSLSRKSSLLQAASKSNPTTAVTTVSPFSSALDIPELPADLMPLNEIKSNTIKKKRKKFLPFASSPQTWFF